MARLLLWVHIYSSYPIPSEDVIAKTTQSEDDCQGNGNEQGDQETLQPLVWMAFESLKGIVVLRFKGLGKDGKDQF